MNEQGRNPVWQRDEVESPCVKVCVIHPQAGICAGCHRTLAEIAAWSAMSATERRSIMDALPARADLLRQRRGGRAGRRAMTGQPAS